MAHRFGLPLTTVVRNRWVTLGSPALLPGFTPENRPFSRSAMIHGPLPEPEPQDVLSPK
jgi:hypothetical protein